MPVLIPLDRLVDSPFQTRQHYDPERIAELAGSIEKDGLIQVPVGRVLYPSGDVAPGSGVYQQAASTGELPSGWTVQLAVGHSRFRAFQLLAEREREAGVLDVADPTWQRMPVQLRPLTDEQMDMLAWAENKERSDLNAIEEASAIRDRIERHGWTHEQAGEALGLSRPAISNKLRLLKLPDGTDGRPNVQAHVAAGTLSEGKARALVSAFEFWENLSDDDREVVEWARKVYGSDGELYGEPAHVLRCALEHGWSAESIQKTAIDADWVSMRRGWKERDEDRKAQEKAEAKGEKKAGPSSHERKIAKIKEERKAKAAKMQDRWEQALTERANELTHCEAGSRVLLAMAMNSTTKPAVERTVKALGLTFEKEYGVEENLAALSKLGYLDAWRLTLGALMAKEIERRKEWDAPAPVYDAVMAGIAHEIETGERIEAERAAEDVTLSDTDVSAETKEPPGDPALHSGETVRQTGPEGSAAHAPAGEGSVPETTEPEPAEVA